MAMVGRNDTCPCGSGRKYKHCCLHIHADEDSRRLRLRAVEGELVPALFHYAAEAFGPEYFAEAWQTFFNWQDAPEEVEQSEEFGTTFDAFFAFEFVPEEDDGEEPVEGWPTEPLALHFLHEAGEPAPDLHREFIEQACRSPVSFFAVEEATPGRSLDLKDILTGKRFRVLEQSASRSLQHGHVLYTRVVTAGGASILMGASPWIIPAMRQITVIDFRESINRKRLLTRDELLDRHFEIRELYLSIVDDLLHPSRPVLHNTDGDLLELTTLTYELDLTPAEAVERLTPLATLDDELHIADELQDASGVLLSATLTWLRPGNRQHKSGDNTVLGRFAVKGPQRGGRQLGTTSPQGREGDREAPRRGRPTREHVDSRPGRGARRGGTPACC